MPAARLLRVLERDAARPGEADSGRRQGVYSRRIAVGLRDGFSALETRALSRRERTSRPSPAARAGREDVVGPAGVALGGSSSFPSRALALDVLLQSQWCALQELVGGAGACELVAGRRAAEGRHL